MNQKHFAVIAVLAIVLVVAVALSIRMKKSGIAPQNTQTDNSVAGETQNVPADGSQPPLAYQKELLEVPANDASDADRLKFFEKVQAAARDADFLEIKSDCQVYPTVMYARLGDSLTVKNTSDSTSTIQVNTEHRYDIPGRGTKTISVDFGNGHGIFGYACNDSPKPVGLFFVVPR